MGCAEAKGARPSALSECRNGEVKGCWKKATEIVVIHSASVCEVDGHSHTRFTLGSQHDRRRPPGFFG
jgi:hypothetical protein